MFCFYFPIRRLQHSEILRYVRVCYYLLLALRRAAHAEYRADVHAVDDGRRTTLTDERQRLTRHRHQAHSHTHVEQRLRHEQQRQSHGEERREVVLAAAGYAPRAEQQYDVEHSHARSAQDAHLLDDDGVDEVAERRRHGNTHRSF